MASVRCTWEVYGVDMYDHNVLVLVLVHNCNRQGMGNAKRPRARGSTVSALGVQQAAGHRHHRMAAQLHALATHTHVHVATTRARDTREQLGLAEQRGLLDSP